MQKKTTAVTLRTAKDKHMPSVWLTAYDASSAMIAEESGVDVILVGDSLGMVSLGYDTTLPVTLDEMIMHTRSVVRGTSKAMVVCDLPFGTYQQSKEQAFETSVKVLQQSQCDAVKLEGGAHMVETVKFLAERGIAVVAHIGMTPQSIKKFGSFGQRGQSSAEQEQLITDAKALESAGAIAIVLEHIPADLSTNITNQLTIPTIGIGAGANCDGQVLVWHDLLGLSKTTPPFAKPYVNLREQAHNAITNWSDDVRSKQFPATKA